MIPLRDGRSIVHDTHTEMPSQQDSPSLIKRRITSVILGVVSLGLLAYGVIAILDVADTYGDALGAGWVLLWILIALVAAFAGAGAAAMWQPPRSSVMTKTFFWIVGAAIVAYGILALLVGP